MCNIINVKRHFSVGCGFRCRCTKNRSERSQPDTEITPGASIGYDFSQDESVRGPTDNFKTTVLFRSINVVMLG